MGGMPLVIAALDTPLSEDGESLALDQLGPLMEFLAARGVDGFFVAGSTGQGPLLSDAEWRELARAAPRAAGGRRVLMNASAPTTREARARVAFALGAGADGVVVATPVAYRYEPRAILQYFRACIEAAGGAPVFLYRKMGDPWGAAELAELAAAYPNLRGIKDSATEMSEHLSLLRVPGLEVFQGYEALTALSVLAGGAGPASGLATVLPEIVVEVTRAAAENAPGLWAMQERLTRARTLVCARNPYAAFKALLELRGIPVGVPRQPFLPLAEGELDQIVRGLVELGVAL